MAELLELRAFVCVQSSSQNEHMIRFKGDLTRATYCVQKLMYEQIYLYILVSFFKGLPLPFSYLSHLHFRTITQRVLIG